MPGKQKETGPKTGFPSLRFEAVIRRFPGHTHIMWVGLLHAGCSDLDKLAIDLKVFDGLGATVAHPCLQASHQLVQDFRN